MHKIKISPKWLKVRPIWCAGGIIYIVCSGKNLELLILSRKPYQYLNIACQTMLPHSELQKKKKKPRAPSFHHHKFKRKNENIQIIVYGQRYENKIMNAVCGRWHIIIWNEKKIVMLKNETTELHLFNLIPLIKKQVKRRLNYSFF